MVSKTKVYTSHWQLKLKIAFCLLMYCCISRAQAQDSLSSIAIKLAPTGLYQSCFVLDEGAIGTNYIPGINHNISVKEVNRLAAREVPNAEWYYDHHNDCFMVFLELMDKMAWRQQTEILANILDHSFALYTSIPFSYPNEATAESSASKMTLLTDNFCGHRPLQSLHFSQVKVDTCDELRRSTIQCVFNGVSQEDLPAFMVLSQIMAQSESSFSTHMVNSGLALNAQLRFNPLSFRQKIIFDLTPNPFGVKACIEAFFDELYAMPLFDYTTKSELDLAKRQIQNNWVFKEDNFRSYVGLASAIYQEDIAADKQAFLDSVALITKVDLLHFTKKYFQRKPVSVHVVVSPRMLDKQLSTVKSTTTIENFTMQYTSDRAYKISNEHIDQLIELAYALSLSPWQDLEITITGQKRKTNKKRAEKLTDYFQAKSLKNKVHFLYRKDAKSPLGEHLTIRAYEKND